MKPDITVAIPFYNSIEYFEDAIRVPLFDDRVSEILVVDDCSTDDQYQQLLNKVEYLLSGAEISFDLNASLIDGKNQHCLYSILNMTLINVAEQAKKIKVIRNEKNLGGFANKYEAIKLAKNEWVYLLDSDNFLVECSIPALYNVEYWNENICYCPSVVIMERKDAWRAWDDWNHRKFGYDPLDLERVKLLYEIDEYHAQTHGCGLGVSGFLNTGNFFVNRNAYLNALQNPIEEKIEPYASDVIAFSYYWLKAKNMLQIIPDLYYYHRLRQDSFWNRTGSQSGPLANRYEDLIKNANA